MLCKIKCVIWVKIREMFLTGHKFTNFAEVSIMTMVHTKGKTLAFQTFRLPENGFTTLKRGANSYSKDIKMKLTLLKKISKVVHFTDFFLCKLSGYSNFEFELKK